jgi:hypothetical protein
VFIIPLSASRMQIHSDGRQPDENFIWSAASQMQISFSRVQIASGKQPCNTNTQIYQ